MRLRNENLIFLYFNQNICCGYSKEPSQWDGSFEYPKHTFNLEVKNIYTNLRFKKCLSGHLRKYCKKNIRLACKSNYYNKETTTETYRFNVYLVLILNTFSITKFREVLSYHRATCTYCPARQSDSDVVFCLQLLSKTLTCTLHLSYCELISPLCINPILRIGIIQKWFFDSMSLITLQTIHDATVTVDWQDSSYYI